MTTAGVIRQCPHCDLRFARRNELDDHLAVDHPVPLDDDSAVGVGHEPPAPARVLVVFESIFGNTRLVAEAVVAGLAAGTKVELVEVGEAPTAIDPEVDLLVVGGPTHALGLSRPETRTQAAEGAGRRPALPGLGLREWLPALHAGVRPPRVAAFDTRIRHLPGSAARAALRRLRHDGFPVATRPTSFYVTGTEGPLAEGELERAERWGEQLAAMATRG